MVVATPAVAASSSWRDDEGTRLPSGDVHAWRPRQNQTLCGVPLSRARLDRFPHVLWIDALWINDTAESSPVMVMCARCAAAVRPRRHRRSDRRARA